MAVPLYVVDAFTDVPFRGNPAAVCILERARPDVWCQSVAAELGLSETAFLVPLEDSWSLRWFTPETEVQLCGHATLASAHVLWEHRGVAKTATLSFHTASGLLSASRLEDAAIELDLPATAAVPVDPPEALVSALGVTPTWTGRAERDFVVVLSDPTEVIDLQPDLRPLELLDSDGVVVTAATEDPTADYVLRYFAPGVGIDEDPVTGYAQTIVGPLWSDRLGRTTLEAHQVSKRGGRLTVTVAGDRVKVAGRAVSVLDGALHAAPEDVGAF